MPTQPIISAETNRTVYKVNELRKTPFINIVILIWHSTVEMITLQAFKSEKAIYTRFSQNENT